MANRYWRGGTGTWNTTTTTNWSATSGGAGGASVPTAADSVFFDQAGTYTVTMTGALTCLDITVSAGTVTFATGTTPTLAISGSMSLLAGTVWSATGAITFNATTTGKTVTTNGTSIGGSVTFDGVGGGWTLGSALTLTANSVTLTNGSFDTGNYNITANGIGSSNSNTRTLTLGSSTISIFVSNGTAVLFTITTGLTFNAGTSQINMTATIPTSQSVAFAGGGLTFNNVSFSGGFSGTGAAQIIGANTFANLSFAGRTTTGIGNITFASDQTITGTLTLSANTNATCRSFIKSNTFNTTRTLTVGTFAAGAADYDFQDIAISGAASPISGTRFGDAKGNSGITFSSAKTVYWNLTGAQSWSSTGWATSSGGSPAIANFPLAQDAAVFDNTGSVTGTITVNSAWNIGTIDMSARTSAMTLSNNTAYSIFGNWINGSGTTISGTSTITFAGRTTQTLTSAGKSFTMPITVNSPGGTLQFQDAFTSTVVSGNNSLQVTSGSLDLNNYSINAPAFFFSGSGNIAFGTGNITVSAPSALTAFASSSAATITGTPNVYVSYTGSSPLTLTPNAPSEANAINFIITSGTFPLTISNASAVKNLDFSNGGTSTFTGSWQGGANSVTCYGNMTLKSGMTVDSGGGTIIFSGASGTKTITSNGVTVDHPMTFSGTGGTVQLQDALTIGSTRTTTLLAGTLDLNTKTLTTGGFSSSGSCLLAFGTGNITLTGSGTVFVGNGTAGSVSGTPNVYLTYSGASAVTITANNPPEASSVNFIVTAGSYSLAISGVSRNLDFSNGGTSTYTGAWAGTTNALTCYGNLTLKSGMTVTGTGTITFAATSGTKTITSAGLTNTHPMTFNGVGGTWQLQDALNIGSNTITLTNGTFDAATYNVTAGSFSSSNSNTRTVAIGSGTWTLSGTGTSPWNTSTNTNLTVTGTGTISLTAATSKTFFSGGLSLPNITLNQGGAGSLSINGTNTFKDITATYIATGAATIFLTVSTTTTVSQFSASGAATKLLTLSSGIAGTRATLALSGGGTVSTDYLNVQDIAFTPAPATDGTTPYVWYLGANSTNSGNNTGGLFQAGGTGALKVYQITNTATTSWTVPSDWNSSSNTIYMIGAGGGGAGASVSGNNRAGGGGGGGGGYRVLTNYSTTPSSSITVALGTGGAAGGQAGAGGTGGSTSWATTNIATGGIGGTSGVTPTSAGGAGGTGTYAGGSGGAGAFGTVASTGYGGGGGGGAGGPNGVGGNGGTGFGSTTSANVAGGGGGGNGGGSNGGNAASATFGAGGNNFSGVGGGSTAGAAGTFGGGGAGGVSSNNGGSGGSGIDILNTIGGAGGRAAAGTSNASANLGLYGGGGAGGGSTTGGTMGLGGAGSQGLIVIAYAPTGGTSYTGAVAETSTATDVFDVAALFGGVISETATATDSLSSQADFYPIILETATGTDAILGSLIFSGVVDESATATDQYLAGLSFSSAFADSLAASDTYISGLAYGGVISESATATDSIGTSWVAMTYVAEASTATDALTTRADFLTSIQEQATGTDAVTVRGTFNVASADSATATDNISMALRMPVSFADSATATDAIQGLNTLSRSISESSTATDSVTRTIIALASLSETATATDSMSLQGTFNVSTDESATITDEALPFGVFNVSLADTVTATDAVLGAYLWNLIDDSQNPGWQNIDNSQAGTWTLEDTNQNPGWTNIQTGG